MASGFETGQDATQCLGVILTPVKDKEAHDLVESSPPFRVVTAGVSVSDTVRDIGPRVVGASDG